MPKETGTEEAIGFFVTFLSLVSFQLGARVPWAPLWLRPCTFGSAITQRASAE